MGLLKPAPCLLRGDELTIMKFLAHLFQDALSQAPWLPFTRAGFVALEQSIHSAFADRLEPTEKVAPGNSAYVRNLSRSHLATGCEFDGQEPRLAPTVWFGGMEIIDDCGYIGPPKLEYSSWHADVIADRVRMSCYFCDLVSELALPPQAIAPPSPLGFAVRPSAGL